MEEEIEQQQGFSNISFTEDPLAQGNLPSFPIDVRLTETNDNVVVVGAHAIDSGYEAEFGPNRTMNEEFRAAFDASAATIDRAEARLLNRDVLGAVMTLARNMDDVAMYAIGDGLQNAIGNAEPGATPSPRSNWER